MSHLMFCPIVPNVWERVCFVMFFDGKKYCSFIILLSNSFTIISFVYFLPLCVIQLIIFLIILHQGKNAPNCSICKDVSRYKCKDCGCYQCGGKQDPHQQIMCDECDMAYHIYCLNPPLETVPDMDEW